LVYRDRTIVFIVVSLVLHALAMLVFTVVRPLLEQSRFAELNARRTKNQDIEIVALNEDQIRKLKKQIVETTLAQKSDKTTDDAYLGAQTQAVKEQTRAKTTGQFKEQVKGAIGAKTTAKNQARQSSDSKKMSRIEQDFGSENIKLGDLGVKMNLQPMGSIGPGETASSSDHLSNMKHGAQTLLNTREFAYFSYYQRVRKQLEQYWEPGLRHKLKTMFDRGRHLAQDKEHATRVLVMLNQEGLITKVQVESTSGLMDLDQAAIDAFNKAGPFPNPPSGMIERDGLIHLEWEFVLKT